MILRNIEIGIDIIINIKYIIYIKRGGGNPKRRYDMKFKPVEWEKRGNGYFASVAFGMQLTVRKQWDNWIWEIGNLSSVFDHGRSDNERTAKANAEYFFQQYVQYVENIGKCTE